MNLDVEWQTTVYHRFFYHFVIDGFVLYNLTTASQDYAEVDWSLHLGDIKKMFISNMLLRFGDFHVIM